MELTGPPAQTTSSSGHSEKLQGAIDDAASGSKRKRNIVEDMQNAHKRAKPEETVDVEAHVGGSNGAIILDDD